VTSDAGAEFARSLDAAANARARMRRSAADVATALERAADLWIRTPGLCPSLAAATGLSAAMLRDALPDTVASFDAATMTALAERETNGAPPPPPIVAHVLASNVPALALPAIAQALLAGTAVVVKSGRNDRYSAPAFRGALEAVDPELARSVVCVDWPRGDAARDGLLLSLPVVVVTGSDATVAALGPHATGRVLTFGTRFSIALVVDATPDALEGLARDIACWEQRGCLSPHVVFACGDLDRTAASLARALEDVAKRWPPTDDVATRAARRTAVDEATWAGGHGHAGAWGAVLVERPGPARATPTGRVVRMQSLDDPPALASRIQSDAVECVGTDLRTPLSLGACAISRLCGLGRMQRPSLAWPRGGRPPIRMLLDPNATTTLEDDR